ncbi:MAG: GNAT family N-acetyltransferase [Alphaproteobacteria bacterium]|nr:GNAT family N-acetyltransferase [Alphaproteobacteria bacterium]
MSGDGVLPEGYDITPLAERPEFVDTCAAWSFGEWGSQYGPSFEETRAIVRQAADPKCLPLGWVAHRAGVPGGMAGLVDCDLESHAHLHPWLAVVFVHPSHRRQGLARCLVRRVEAEARALGFVHLHLFTYSSVPLYASLGWRILEAIDDAEGRKTIMVQEL